MNSLEKTQLESKIIEALQTCYDPEIPVNIYELGLVYAIHVGDSGDVQIEMALTAPNCPAAASLPAEVQAKVAGIKDVQSVKVDIVWDPPWDPSRISESAKLQLGII